jgi:hypothetical protein
MHSNTNDSILPWSYVFFLRSFLTIIILAGCAQPPPWQDPLNETDANQLSQELDQLSLEGQNCRNTLEGDLKLTYHDPLRTIALQGFLRLAPTGRFRFVSSNPLGQPVFIVAGDTTSFQSIGTLQRRYLAGNLTSFALRFDIPLSLVQANWWKWLTAYPAQDEFDASSAYYDREEQGYWVSPAGEGNKEGGSSYILVEPQNSQILSRIVTDKDSAIVARIDYQDYQDIGQCRQPQRFIISKLAYGAELTIELHDIIHSKATLEDRLPIPRGYLRQYLP